MHKSATTLGIWAIFSSACLPAAYAQDSDLKLQQLRLQVQTPALLKPQDEALEKVAPQNARECDGDKPYKGRYDEKKRYGYGHGYGKRK